MEDYQAPQKMKRVDIDMSRFQVAKSKITNERQELIERFVTKLNNSRVSAGYKKLGAGFYASKMSHIPTDELHFFYQKCDKADNFSKIWWWTCCPKKK